MILFHQRGSSQKSYNNTTDSLDYVLPKESGTLATNNSVYTDGVNSLIEKPVLIYPTNETIDYENYITVSRFIPNKLYKGNKTGITIQAATDSNFTNKVYDNFYLDTDESSKDIPLPLDYSNTILYIRYRYHSDDYCSVWSDTSKITTKTFAVLSPTILTPIDGTEGVPLNLLVMSGDFEHTGVSDTHVSTHFQLSTDIGFNTLLYDVESTVDLFSFVYKLTEGINYYIRARYRGSKYGYSNWCSTVNITTLVPFIHKPNILSPTNNSVGISNRLRFSSTPFRFTGNGDTHYSTHYQISKNTDFTDLYYDEETTDDKTNKVLDVGEGVTYYIRIRYRGAKYDYSEWSSTVKITTVTPYVKIPTILTPSSNTEGVPLSINITTNEFSYIGASDEHYSTHYQVSLNANFTSTLLNTESTTSLLKLPATLDKDKIHYIRVRHKGVKYGYSGWSNTIKITTVVPYIHTPTVTSPTGVYKSVKITASAFKFTGNGDTHYSTHYQVAKDIGFTDIHHDSESTTEKTSKTVELTTVENVNFYIRVRHKGNLYGYSEWSPARNVKTVAPYVLAPVITSPAYGAEGIGSNISVTTLGFRYVGENDSLRSIQYKAYSDANLNNLVYDSGEKVTSNASFTASLPANRVLYLTVRHRGNNYGYSGWSAPLKIRTNIYTNFLSIYSAFSMTVTPKFTNSGITLEYSIDDGSSWVPINSNQSTPTKHYFWFRGRAVGTKSLFSSNSSANKWEFNGGATLNFSQHGPLTSLLCDNLGDEESPRTIGSFAFSNMFLNNDQLLLPPKIPIRNIPMFAFNSTFKGCTRLTTPLSFQGINTVGERGCESMYEGSGLVNPPALPAMNLSRYSYAKMFKATKLNRLADLPATLLPEQVYHEMYATYNPPISTIKKIGYGKPWQYPTTGVGVTLSPMNSGGFLMFGGNAIFSPNTTYYTP